MAGFISDAASSIIDNIRQKRKSPLYGAFAFSWIAYNWKPVSIFIFSKKDIYGKIQDVSTYASLNDQVIYPAMMAVIIVLLMPTLHAFYSYFDAVVEVLHDSSNSLKEWYSSVINRRKERARAFESIQNELTSAEEKKKIAELNRQAAEAEQQEALIRVDLVSVSQLQDERIRLQRYETEMIDKYTNIERQYEVLLRKYHLYENVGEFVIGKSDELLSYIEDVKMHTANQTVDPNVLHQGLEEISQRMKRAQAGPVMF